MLSSETAVDKKKAALFFNNAALSLVPGAAHAHRSLTRMNAGPLSYDGEMCPHLCPQTAKDTPHAID